VPSWWCGAALVLLVAGVCALVRDVEDTQVGVRALHLLRGQASLCRVVRAPVVAPATTSCQCRTLELSCSMTFLVLGVINS
jgi:hypothetical protein